VSIICSLIEIGLKNLSKVDWDISEPSLLKVALRQKILENIYFSKINIPNHYPQQKI
jgi:hypothetical protein